MTLENKVKHFVAMHPVIGEYRFIGTTEEHSEHIKRLNEKYKANLNGNEVGKNMG